MQELDDNDPRTLQDGRYTLQKVIGEGSMGRTYLAAFDDTRVAVKALYPSRLATAKDLQLFVREAEVLQRLDHPQVPSYVDAFDEGEGEAVRYHLVQEFVDGDTLRQVIQRGDRYDEQQIGELLKSLLGVLVYLHRCDPVVVHRDIKPDNVILRASDGKPVLVDFGAVREVVRLTMGGGSTIIGTYGYMPPEQLMGRALPASDIYSVGITALELLTRQTPQDLHGKDALRLIDQANVSEELKRVLRRMCAPNLTDRYGDAAQVLGDLEAALGGGALVHAGSIEKAIEVRAKEEEQALKKASRPAIVHLGYISLVAILVLAAVAAAITLANLIAMNFEGVFVAAGGVSGFALFITLMLLGKRYTHDGWEPPTAKWSKTRGSITKHTRIEYGEAQDPTEQSMFGTVIRAEYRFETKKRGQHVATFSFPESKLELYPIGREFDVYYRPENPQWHEFQDFINDPDNVMPRLFNASVVHTPE